MPHVIAIMNQKGGSGKTTTSVAVATLLAERRRVMLVDADPSGTAAHHLDQADRAGVLPASIEYTAETRVGELEKLRRIPRYDVIVVDTPAERDSGRLITIGRQVDHVVMPTQVSAYDLRGLGQTIRDVIIPCAISFKILFTRVPVRAGARVEAARTDLVERGYRVYSRAIRELVAHQDVALEGLTVATYRADRYAREAELDYRMTTVEIMEDLAERGDR